MPCTVQTLEHTCSAFFACKLRSSNVTRLRAGLSRCLAPARHKRVNGINPAALGKLHVYDFLASRGLFASSLARPFELYSDIVLHCGGGPSHQQDLQDGILSDAEGSFDGILKDQSCIDSKRRGTNVIYNNTRSAASRPA
jgi:hypothetical protein